MNKEIIAPKFLLPYYYSWKISKKSRKYNVCFSYTLNSFVNTQKLRAAIEILVELRPNLRAHFKLTHNCIKYAVNKNLPPIFKNINIKNEEDYYKKINELMNEEHNLHQGSLLKCTFINRLYNNDNVIFFNIHHAVIDGSTVDKFLEDICKIYNGICPQKESDNEHINSLLKLSKLEQKIDDKDLKKYINKVNEINNKNEKYIFDEKSDIISSRGKIDNEKSIKIEQFLKYHNISGFNFFLLSWCIFEAKLFNKNGLIVTYPINIKNHKDENGCMVNTINYPFQYNNQISILNVIDEFLQNIPVLKKLRYVNFLDYIQSNDINNSHFTNSQYAKFKPLELENEIYNPITYPQMANSAFGMKYMCDGRNFYFLSDCYKDILPENISKNLCHRFINFIEKLIKNPQKNLSNIDILFEKEYYKIVSDFNKTEKAYTNNKSISKKFEDIAEKFSDKLAAIDEFKSFTYLKLNQLANQLGRTLIQKNIKQTDIVPILIDNRIEMLIGILAVLKVGAAYLPISHDTPLERIKNILNESNSKVMLSIPNLSIELENNIHIINLFDQNNFHENTSNLDISVSEKNAAYVIFTSGSTGKPKGVVIENKSIINLIEFLMNKCNISDNDNISKYSSFSFDASVIEIYTTLLSGATLYFVPNDIRIDVHKINSYFNLNNITFSFLPTQFAEIFTSLNNYSLKNLIIGGDKMKVYNNINYNLINAYGPTEASVCTTVFDVNKNSKNIPIGKPIQNAKVYILNKDLSLCLNNTEGEIYIGGEILAQKYLNNEKLTNEKFIPNPFQTLEEKIQGINARIYKTGDLGKINDDYNLLITGRSDFQIKINGFRIESGEIENQMLLINEIRNVCIIDFKDKSDQKYLCAYYESNNILDTDYLRNFLKKSLPYYMIPRVFQHMNFFPINNNGKIDRKKLPEPNLKKYISNNNIVPKNEKEILIAKIFSDILEIDNLSTSDDFFQLGGNSLKAIHLTSKLQQYFDVDVSKVFIFRTIQNLSNSLAYKN
ncbi:non-ribosomal peptide synthetase [Silvanigrella aquatica]|uniref:Carrier domain-containing protein n=1 Tax=Silvanigrella aquatica TaxID=1915309 RepID=A0A1L4D259_9BACT|nr:non-ribosomal peptide synthetase [Silvanigrella aquatica]APJ04289.1 hypothetical protein AXG55_10375 [Silvanigrella aquatica]